MQNIGNLEIDGQVIIKGGSPGVGKILTSDAYGTGSWANNTSSSIINGVTGSGTLGRLPIWVSSSGLGNSVIIDSSTHYSCNIPFQPYNHVRFPNTVTFSDNGTTLLTESAVFEMLPIRSDNGNNDPYNRRVTLSNGLLMGQQKFFQWISGNLVVPNSGKMKLIADWIPLVSGDCLKVGWNGNHWVEEYRYPPYTGFLSGIVASTGSSSSSFTNGVTGSGTVNTLAMWVSSSGVGNSPITYNPSNDYLRTSKKFSIGTTALPPTTIYCNQGISYGPTQLFGDVPLAGMLVNLSNVYFFEVKKNRHLCFDRKRISYCSWRTSRSTITNCLEL